MGFDSWFVITFVKDIGVNKIFLSRVISCSVISLTFLTQRVSVIVLNFTTIHNYRIRENFVRSKVFFALITLWHVLRLLNIIERSKTNRWRHFFSMFLYIELKLRKLFIWEVERQFQMINWFLSARIIRIIYHELWMYNSIIIVMKLKTITLTLG